MVSTHAVATNVHTEYRKLPAVDALLHMPELALLAAEVGDAALTAAVRTVLADARHAIRTGEAAPAPDAWLHLVMQHLGSITAPSLRPVINATGVIVHTNLGRAPLSAAALAADARVAAGYSTLAYLSLIHISGPTRTH